MGAHLRIIRGEKPTAAPHLVDLAAQAAEMAGRLVRSGDLAHALDALQVARTLLEHVQGAA